MKSQYIIIKVIITFILLSNIAWAFDLDEIQALSSDVQLLDTQNQNTEIDQIPCDHCCCHGSAHYVGLFSRETDFTPVFIRNFPRTSLQNNYFYTYQPPTPPPLS